jgi:hypothetical protein
LKWGNAKIFFTGITNKLLTKVISKNVCHRDTYKIFSTGFFETFWHRGYLQKV